MTIALPDDFRDLLVALADAGARFIVVGGYAVGFHGHMRATKDLDVYVEPSPENALRVERGLTRFGAPLRALGVSVKDFEGPDITVQLGVPPLRIDLLTAADGIDFEEAWATHETLDVDGRSWHFDLGGGAFTCNWCRSPRRTVSTEMTRESS
jgi:hypothetical protein